MDKISIIEVDGKEYTIGGESAYETAVRKGFEGTEEEWLESLTDEVKIKAADAIQAVDESIEQSKEETIKARTSIADTETSAVEHIEQMAEEALNIVQDTGSVETAVMSQRACTASFLGVVKDHVEGKDITITDIAETPHDVKVAFNSKNMFNKATINEKKSLIINPNEKYGLGDLGTSNSEEKFVSDYIEVEEGKTYHINYINEGSQNDHRFYAVGYDADKNGIVCVFNKYPNECPYDDSENCNFTVPVGMGIKYVRFQGLLVDLDTLQLELGDTATEYTPFTEEITVATDNGSGEIAQTKTVRNGEVAEFNSIYPTMRIYTTSDATIKVTYNVDMLSMFVNEGEEWGD